jgi:hypothetical protein
MSEVLNIDFKTNRILVTLELSTDEYNIIKHHREMLVMPTNSFNDILTTGTLGNSNRIMLPNKILKKNDIMLLKKKVRSSILKAKNGKYLVIQLEGPNIEIPEFK